MSLTKIPLFFQTRRTRSPLLCEMRELVALMCSIAVLTTILFAYSLATVDQSSRQSEPSDAPRQLAVVRGR